jgi:uncharacterized protein
MTTRFKIFSIIFIGLLFSALGWSIMCADQEQAGQTPFYSFTKEGELFFFTPDSEQVTQIDIEFADDADEIVLGLMFRRSMRENQGMLFIFDSEAPRSFWMKDTYFSLDMIFVDSNKEIVSIARETSPLSEQNYRSEKPAQYVVEVNAGFAKKHGIVPGYKIDWQQTTSK